MAQPKLSYHNRLATAANSRRWSSAGRLRRRFVAPSRPFQPIPPSAGRSPAAGPLICRSEPTIIDRRDDQTRALEMADGATDILADKKALARRRAYEAPLETMNPAWASAFRDDAHWPYFERLRAEDPVHWTPDSNYGAFWSITKFNDIMAIDTNHGVFSSARGIGLSPKPGVLPPEAYRERETPEGDVGDDANSFINMDP